MRILGVLVVMLALAGPASAATPRFGIFDLQSDLANASKNDFGDVKVASRQLSLAAKAPDATLVRCARDCRFGPGWLAFAKGPSLRARDLVSAKAHRIRGTNWGVTVKLTSLGESRWKAFGRTAARSAELRGVPDALVVVVDGAILSQPLVSDLRRTARTLELTGFSRSGAQKTALILR